MPFARVPWLLLLALLVLSSGGCRTSAPWGPGAREAAPTPMSPPSAEEIAAEVQRLADGLSIRVCSGSPGHAQATLTRDEARWDDLLGPLFVQGIHVPSGGWAELDQDSPEFPTFVLGTEGTQEEPRPVWVTLCWQEPVEVSTAGGTVSMARAILLLDPRVKETLDIYLEAGRGRWRRFGHSAGIAEFKRWYTEVVSP